MNAPCECLDNAWAIRHMGVLSCPKCPTIRLWVNSCHSVSTFWSWKCPWSAQASSPQRCQWANTRRENWKRGRGLGWDWQDRPPYSRDWMERWSNLCRGCWLYPLMRTPPGPREKDSMGWGEGEWEKSWPPARWTTSSSDASWRHWIHFAIHFGWLEVNYFSKLKGQQSEPLAMLFGTVTETWERPQTWAWDVDSKTWARSNMNIQNIKYDKRA